MNSVNIIHPSVLTNEWLHSEYHGIIRLVDHIKEIGFKRLSNIPFEYNQDRGRIKFFYDKLEFLVARHIQVKEEILKRKKLTNKFQDNYDLTIDHKLLSESFSELYNNWQPSKRDYALDTARLYGKWLLRKREFSYYNEVYRNQLDWVGYSAKILNKHQLDQYRMRDIFKVVEVNTLLQGNERLPL